MAVVNNYALQKMMTTTTTTSTMASRDPTAAPAIAAV